MKTLLVIENDNSLERADYVKAFLRTYEGETIIMTGFGHKSDEEIFKAVSKCTDIVVQTCFIGGSDSQFDDMLKLLSHFKKPININIAYLGNGEHSDLYDYIERNSEPEKLLRVNHHIINSLIWDRKGIRDLDICKLDFSKVLTPFLKAHTKKRVHELYLQWYKETAKNRPTGKKVLVLGCTAHGKAFQNLPIGQEVDVLECDDLLETKNPPRGVWIWGNGEPIMLVNDNGFREYKITTKLTSEGILDEIGRVINSAKDLRKLKEIKLRGLLHIIEDKEESAISKANLICEQLKIEKRGNRQNIYTLLQEN